MYKQLLPIDDNDLLFIDDDMAICYAEPELEDVLTVQVVKKILSHPDIDTLICLPSKKFHAMIPY